jgi:hypothetical protein
MDIILYATCTKGANGVMEYRFVTNNDGTFPARSPIGMFEDITIPNDFGYIVEKIDEYYN